MFRDAPSAVFSKPKANIIWQHFQPHAQILRKCTYNRIHKILLNSYKIKYHLIKQQP